MAGPARKRKTFGTKIRDQELETKDLYTVVNNKQILQSSKGVVSGGTVNNTEINNGPGGSSDAASLATAGGSMIGPIAFYVKTKTIASGRLDILSGGTAYSSRVIAAPEGSSADDLIKIGDANNSADFSGQLLFVQGSIANITLKHAASTGNIWIPGGSDFILIPGAIAILQYDESNITGSSNAMWILVASFGGGSTGANKALSNLDSTTAVNSTLIMTGNSVTDLQQVSFRTAVATPVQGSLFFDGTDVKVKTGGGEKNLSNIGTGVGANTDLSNLTSTGEAHFVKADASSTTFSGDVIFDTTATGSESSAPIKFQGDGANTAQRIMELGKEGLHQIKVIGEIQGVAPFTIQNPDGSGANDYTIPSNGQGMNIDTSIVMNTHNIYDLDQLVFARGTSSLTPTWNDDFIGFEFTQASDGTDSGLGYNVDANLRHRFYVHGDEILTIHNDGISGGATSQKIGIHVSQNTGKGSKGQMEIPYHHDSSYPTSTELTTYFGDDSGSIAIFRNTSGTDRLYFKTGDGWNYINSDGIV